MQESLINKEKIIRGLKCCLLDNTFTCGECPYHNEQDRHCKDQLGNDAINMLFMRGTNFYPCQYCTRYKCDRCLYHQMCRQNIYRCKNCGMIIKYNNYYFLNEIDNQHSYCPGCGKQQIT